MNKAKLKSYAPQARKDFIAAVTARANQLGISEDSVSAAERRGDILIIDGREWPAAIGPQRDRLIQRIGKLGFNQTMEAIAYTWFNRIAALRYMEIHDYLGHGHRVLSSREDGLPEVLRHAADIGLAGLNPAKVQEMQLAGNRDGELYKMVLVAQCNALSTAMPFLFEHIDDETELLLPDNLLRTDSIIAKLIEAVPEEDWQQVEVIGWLYQFYISDKKDEVIGKVVKSEDIPAATQLFTPNWIVQYLVQNSVGRLWMMANPASTLKSQWPYYIEPAEQTPEAQAQLDALIQARMAEDGGSLNPETITVLDPACGSGHILVEAYELLKGIYLERGYQPRSIPRLILEKNLYGLDIDDRAAQLAGFALLMKARADDRRLLDSPLRLNVLSMQESKGLNLEELSRNLQSFGISRTAIALLVDTFANAKTFGSLIQISDALDASLPKITQGLISAREKGDVFARLAAEDLIPFVSQAVLLSMEFDAVVANPPYMGAKFFTPMVKAFLKENYIGFEKDLFSAFMVRDLLLTKESGQLGFMSPFVWMFISSYEELRQHFLEQATLTSLVQLEYSGFDGATVPICTFTLSKSHVSAFIGSYIRLSDFRGADQQGPKTLEAIKNTSCGWFYTAMPDNFKKIPGCPVAYWASDEALSCFGKSAVEEYFTAKKGMAIGDNARFLRLWQEIDVNEANFDAKDADDTHNHRWFPCLHGGSFRKWGSNKEFVVNWKDDGKEPKGAITSKTGDHWSRYIISTQYFFRSGINWSAITSGKYSARFHQSGFAFTSASMAAFSDTKRPELLLAMVNSEVGSYFFKLLSPTLNYGIAELKKIPLIETSLEAKIISNTERLVALSTIDWNTYERSWGFQSIPILNATCTTPRTIESNYSAWVAKSRDMVEEMKRLEEENNRIFIAAYGLAIKLRPEVPIEQISLTVNPSYRYGADLSEVDQRDRFRLDSTAEMISYAIGCMMGRYSLDEPGLIYANAGNIGFDATRYKTFPADADGIVPLTDELWFEDDAANRVREFVLAVWGAEKLEENMAWLADSLGRKGNETPEETIRRYVAGSFYKDHLQTYKKRPIYWLFSSGKQGAFQCLVYLHRYHEGTLSRMRAEYVVPLTAKMAARIDLMSNDAEAATSAAARTKINKQIEVLRKKQTELLAFDEKLRHYADMRIKLDLDDGVKVNYGKFGDLLDSVKAIAGANDE